MTNRILSTLVVLWLATIAVAASTDRSSWTAEEIDELRSLSLSGLGPQPADRTNRVADRRHRPGGIATNRTPKP